MEKDIQKGPKLDYDGEPEKSSRLDKPRLAQRLKEVIAAAGGNKKIAAKTGIPLSTINNYTTGESEPKLSAAALISAACGVSLNWLAYGEGPRHAADAAPGRGPETKSLTQITLTVYDSIYDSGKMVSPVTFANLLSSFYNFYKEMDGVEHSPPDEAKWQRLKELLAVALKASRE